MDTKGVQLPYLDGLAIVFFVEPAKIAERLGAGELDLALQRVDFVEVKIKDAQAFASAAEKAGFRMLHAHDTVVTFVTFNQDSSDEALRRLFRDVRFRRAIAHLIDRQNIIREALKGFGFAQEEPLLRVSPFFDAEATAKFPFSLERANTILDELGLRERTKEGFRKLPDGRALKIELITNDNNEARVNLGPLLVRTFAQAGIKLDFKPIPFDALLGKIGLRGAKPDYEAVIIGFSAAIFAEDWESLFASWGRSHLYKFSDAEGRDLPEYQRSLDEIFRKQVSEYDLQRRRALFAEFQRLVTENLPLIFLYTPMYQVAIRPQIGNADTLVVIEFATGLIETLWRKDQ